MVTGTDELSPNVAGGSNGGGNDSGSGSGFLLDGILDGSGSESAGIGSGVRSHNDEAGTEAEEGQPVRRARGQGQPKPLETIVGAPGGSGPASNGRRAGKQAAGGTKKPANVKVDVTSANFTSAMFITLFQGMAVATLGGDARFTEAERKLIEPSLSRLIARLPAKQAALLIQWIDPAMLVFGLGMWSVRMFKLAQADEQRNQEPNRESIEREPLIFPQAPPMMNGSAVSTGIPERGPVVAPVPDDIQRLVTSDY